MNQIDNTEIKAEFSYLTGYIFSVKQLGMGRQFFTKDLMQLVGAY